MVFYLVVNYGSWWDIFGVRSLLGCIWVPFLIFSFAVRTAQVLAWGRNILSFIAL